jgi:hypothetical protein
MSIYNDLDVIDAFEERCGFDATLKRARAFMITYVDLMKKTPLDATKRSLEVARKCAAGILSLHDLEVKREAVWQFLKQRNAVIDYETPSDAIVHAVFGPLTERENPKPGETISERVSNFFDCANRFEDHFGSVACLLRECFAL